MGNFSFLEIEWPDLAKLGDLSEQYLYSDPNASIIKQGMLCENMVKYMLAYDGIEEPEFDNTHANRIRLLKKKDLLPYEVKNTLYILRKDRNEASHNGMDEAENAKSNLPLLYDLCVWFMQTYGNHSFKASEYHEPKNEVIDAKVLEQENAALEIRINELQNKIIQIQTIGKPDSGRRTVAYARASGINLNEAQTRELIDEQLRKVGWEVDTKILRYSNGTRPQPGKNLAIAEWPTDSRLGDRGYADYALFVGEKLVGIVEAKKKNKDVSSVLDFQCKDYSKMIKAEHQIYVVKKYFDYCAPFLFSTNGRPYLEQYKEKSGIWFLDVRKDYNAPHPLTGWPRPEEVEEDLSRDVTEAEEKLVKTGYEVLQDPDGLNLRYYQIDAIKAAEAAILEHKNTVLLAMATGTGKTRTVLGLIYRFLSAKRFKRILYLVDRTALGDQTKDTFETVRLEDLKTLNKIYDIKNLEDKDFEKDTRVQIATVQGLVKRVLYNESDTQIGVSDYDLIIVDEAHRGYVLDKEMSEDEVYYLDQEDFQSKYRAVIDYFDAVKIALTATPALHTTEIFGKPVFTYDYTTAVVDGYLVDHDVPHRIWTKLSSKGIKFEAGESVPIYNPTSSTIDYAELEDEIDFEIEDFNRRVINENFDKAVLEEIAKDIDPTERAKTLVFAVDDAHADRVTRILKDIYSRQGVPNDAIMKITGSIENGDHKKIQEAIRKFKNDQYPNIVVTVDLLTTGIDVEEISNLVFMRRVKSRILFEQMLGRATRLCPEIGKTHFEIYDAVKVYDALEPVSSMKPVTADPTRTFENLIDGFEVLNTEEKKRLQIDMIIAKMRRTIGKMSKEDKEQFASLTGGRGTDDFVEFIHAVPVDTAVDELQKKREAFKYVRAMHCERPVFISEAEDEVVSHIRGYGDATKPEDYLREFRDFIDSNLNKVAALNIVATRPQELTREALKELKLFLDRNNFNETYLQTAWREMTNEDIAADVISFIRQHSLGDALISKEDRIHTAIEKTKRSHPELGRLQLNWLDKIESYLLKETVLNRESFNAEAFKNKGGYNAINRAFDEKLDAIIEEINGYMYSA